jgi:hypothetical protein
MMLTTVSRRELFQELSDAQWDLKLYADGCTTLCTALNEDPINPVIYSALHVRLEYVKSYPEAKAVPHLYNIRPRRHRRRSALSRSDCKSCVKPMKIYNTAS